jgi:hypothetical protein
MCCLFVVAAADRKPEDKGKAGRPKQEPPKQDFSRTPPPLQLNDTSQNEGQHPEGNNTNPPPPSNGDHDDDDHRPKIPNNQNDKKSSLPDNMKPPAKIAKPSEPRPPPSPLQSPRPSDRNEVDHHEALLQNKTDGGSSWTPKNSTDEDRHSANFVAEPKRTEKGGKRTGTPKPEKKKGAHRALAVREAQAALAGMRKA